MKNSKYSQILDSLIGDQIPSNLNLAPKIRTKIQKQKGAMMNRRKKVLVPIAVGGYDAGSDHIYCTGCGSNLTALDRLYTGFWTGTQR